MSGRGADYWAARRKKQWKRFGGKLVKTYDRPSTATIAASAWSGVKYLRTLVNSEKHKLDTVITTSISSTGAITNLSAIAQGDAINQRTGNSVLATGVHLNMVFSLNASATASYVRALLFIDKQQVGDTSPSGSDLITGNYTGHLAASTVGRFQILFDYLFPLNDVGLKNKVIRKYIKLNKHIRFNGTASSDIQKGGLYMLLFSNEATNSVNTYIEARLG